MVQQLVKRFFSKTGSKSKPSEKIFFTLFIIFLFRVGNTIPICGIDQEAIRKALSQLGNQNSIIQIINMYSGGSGKFIISPFSLGIIPFINASILIDLLTTLIPFLEKLQSEEGEEGKRKLMLYKKTLTFVFAIAQSALLIYYCFPYFYATDLFNLAIVIIELVTGSLIIVWMSNLIEKKGIGNGTSIIIFTNIITNLIGKNWFTIFNENKSILNIGSQILILVILVALICISQIARMNIEVVSARQLSFLENEQKNSQIEKNYNLGQKKDQGLSIRLNQAGIFPIIIASNLLPFFSYVTNSLKLLESFIYYFLIIGFNYFYTIVFWDPEKISEQLRKASVSIVNITPGKETISYLENVVKATSIIGGIFLSLILFSYDLIRKNFEVGLLTQINISSLIILIGVAYELQKTIRSLYINVFE